jgi:molybdopterin converting factor small subunit
MPAHILFFGAAADIAGDREIEWPVTEGLTASTVLEMVRERMPRLASHNLFISVNEQYATGEEVIRDGDEVAVFTPVSGG